MDVLSNTMPFFAGLAAAGTLSSCALAYPSLEPCPTPQDSFKAIDRKVRLALPLRSALVTAEKYLKSCGIEHTTVDKNKVVYAIVRNIKGSWVVSEAASIRIFYDDTGMVSKIEIFSSFL